MLQPRKQGGLQPMHVVGGAGAMIVVVIVASIVIHAIFSVFSVIFEIGSLAVVAGMMLRFLRRGRRR